MAATTCHTQKTLFSSRTPGLLSIAIFLSFCDVPWALGCSACIAAATFEKRHSIGGSSLSFDQLWILTTGHTYCKIFFKGKGDSLYCLMCLWKSSDQTQFKGSFSQAWKEGFCEIISNCTRSIVRSWGCEGVGETWKKNTSVGWQYTNKSSHMKFSKNIVG